MIVTRDNMHVIDIDAEYVATAPDGASTRCYGADVIDFLESGYVSSLVITLDVVTTCGGSPEYRDTDGWRVHNFSSARQA